MITMKNNINDKTAEVITQVKLHKAYLSCIRKKSQKKSFMSFFYNLEKNLLNLFEDLDNRNYQPQQYNCFVVEEPVIREIFAPTFKDRIVHHLLINEIEPYFEKRFIYDSFACRKGKGVHLGVKRLQSGLKSLARKNKNNYYLKLDIKGFFMSIDRTILFNILKKKITSIAKKEQKSQQWLGEVLYLCEVIIKSDPTLNYLKLGNPKLFRKVPKNKSLFYSGKNKGIPIGSLTSQFFANVYLNELDHFVKRDLKQYYYYRYVDDFVILGQKETLVKVYQKIVLFLAQTLQLKLNEKKTILEPIHKGIDFLGYIIRDKYILVRKTTVKRLEKRLALCAKKMNGDLEKLINFNALFCSSLSVFKVANDYRLNHYFTTKYQGEIL
jgi:hypothetical protein